MNLPVENMQEEPLKALANAFVREGVYYMTVHLPFQDDPIEIALHGVSTAADAGKFTSVLQNLRMPVCMQRA